MAERRGVAGSTRAQFAHMCAHACAMRARFASQRKILYSLHKAPISALST